METDWMEGWRAEMQARLDLVCVGAWRALCCEEDLYEIETEAEAEKLRAELREQIENPDPPCTTGRIYRSKREAFEHFATCTDLSGKTVATVEEVERRYNEIAAERVAQRARRSAARTGS